jgi:hypothetical protein
MSSISELKETLAHLREARAHMSKAMTVIEEEYERLNVQIEKTLELIHSKKQ